MANPLDQFKTATPESADFELPQMPKLAQLLKTHGYRIGFDKYDEAMSNWRRDLVFNVNKKAIGKAAVQTGSTG
ncbi:MAG: hypothetical protein WC655_03520 [Candidatus Hydrogenedentales bacterium]|jgi:hypothetical protein